MPSIIEFAEEVRVLQDKPGLAGAISAAGTVPDDEDHCVVADALGVPVGLSKIQTWAEQGRWVMRFDDRLVARRVGIVLGLEWSAEPAEVELPGALVDVAVAQHHGLLEEDQIGWLTGWWIPVGEGSTEWLLRSPNDNLIEDTIGWNYPKTL